MLSNPLVALAALALASATPIRREESGGCAGSTSQSSPTLPHNGGGTELPELSDGLVLKYIALGHGIQNYTCAAGQEAEAAGALAVLYDATALFPGNGPSSLPSEAHFNAVATTALWTLHLPLNSDNATQFGAAPSLSAGSGSGSASGPFPAPAGVSLPASTRNISLPFLGQHIFDADGVPTFYTGESEADAEVLFKAELLDKTDAPQTADPGPFGTGAVAWLYLGDGGGSRGLSRIYRVVTAGGSPSKGPCDEDAQLSVPYTTYYWMYGPESED